MKLSKVNVLAIILLLFMSTAKGQEVSNESETRAELELSYKPIKKVKLSFMPQLRFDEDFSLDKYLLEADAEYKVLKFLELGASYSFVANLREIKDTEYFNRYAISATAKKELGRFEPAFRLKYSNYADDDVSDKNFIRYKAALDYDIPDCKLTPFVAAEFFQQFDSGDLYKVRYSAGLDYKLFKNNSIGASYKFDYYNKEYINKHIISLGYKIKF